MPEPQGRNPPRVNDVLDDQRFREIQRESILIAGLWLSLALAAERHDKADCNHAGESIARLTKATFAMVKALGMETTP